MKLEEKEQNKYLIENDVDDIALDLKDNPKRFIFEVQRLFKKLSDYCPHWDMTYWDSRNEIWEWHKHPDVCQTYRNDNNDYHYALCESY